MSKDTLGKHKANRPTCRNGGRPVKKDKIRTGALRNTRKANEQFKVSKQRIEKHVERGNRVGPLSELFGTSLNSYFCGPLGIQVSTATFGHLWGHKFLPLLLGTFCDAGFNRYCWGPLGTQISTATFWEPLGTQVSTATFGNLWGHRFQPLLLGHRFPQLLLETFGERSCNRYFWGRLGTRVSAAIVRNLWGDTGFNRYFW